MPPARSLDGIRGADGLFRILAIDHRDSLRAYLAPDEPDVIDGAELTAIKIAIARAILPLATGVMLEPEFSIPQLTDAGVVPDGVGFTAALESQGYLDDPGAAPTAILDGWSIEQAAASGASAAKLLVPYHPDHPLASEQERVAADVLAGCRAIGMPLVLEPLFFGLRSPDERTDVVLRTVDRFAALGPDLLKLPFPVDPTAEPDRDRWRLACADVGRIAGVPWVLLSGGGSFESFAAQVEIAVGTGCAGYMVGRALWGEAALAPPDRRETVIEELVVPRWHRLTDVAVRAATGEHH